MKQTPFKKLRHLELIRDLDDVVAVLPIAPTMQKVVHDGETYFRMDGMRRQLDDGSQAATYLWDGWGKKMRAELAAKEAACPTT